MDSSLNSIISEFESNAVAFRWVLYSFERSIDKIHKLNKNYHDEVNLPVSSSKLLKMFHIVYETSMEYIASEEGQRIVVAKLIGPNKTKYESAPQFQYESVPIRKVGSPKKGPAKRKQLDANLFIPKATSTLKKSRTPASHSTAKAPKNVRRSQSLRNQVANLHDPPPRKSYLNYSQQPSVFYTNPKNKSFNQASIQSQVSTEQQQQPHPYSRFVDFKMSSNIVKPRPKPAETVTQAEDDDAPLNLTIAFTGEGVSSLLSPRIPLQSNAIKHTAGSHKPNECLVQSEKSLYHSDVPIPLLVEKLTSPPDTQRYSGIGLGSCEGGSAFVSCKPHEAWVPQHDNVDQFQHDDLQRRNSQHEEPQQRQLKWGISAVGRTTTAITSEVDINSTDNTIATGK